MIFAPWTGVWVDADTYPFIEKSNHIYREILIIPRRGTYLEMVKILMIFSKKNKFNVWIDVENVG